MRKKSDPIFGGVELFLYVCDRLYLSMKELAESRLQDGTGRKPHYR